MLLAEEMALFEKIHPTIEKAVIEYVSNLPDVKIRDGLVRKIKDVKDIRIAKPTFLPSETNLVGKPYTINPLFGGFKATADNDPYIGTSRYFTWYSSIEIQYIPEDDSFGVTIKEFTVIKEDRT